MQAASVMARGLSLITSDQGDSLSGEIPIDDLVVVIPGPQHSQPVVEHPPVQSHSGVPIASNAVVDHNANSSSSHSHVNNEHDASGDAPDRLVVTEGSEVVADFDESRGSYASFTSTSRSLPSLQDTRTAGQVLFTQFCRQHLPASVPLEIEEDAIPEDFVPPDVNLLMQ